MSPRNNHQGVTYASNQYMNWKKKIPASLKLRINYFRSKSNLDDFLGRFAPSKISSYIASGVASNCWSLVCVRRDAQIQRGTLLHVNKLSDKPQICIDERVFIGQNCYFSSGQLIEIGRDSLVGASCKFLGAGHEYDDPTIPYAKAKVVSYGQIVLEPNTWIGTGSTIVGNVRIGFGSVVAANTNVRKSLPPLCLVAGNPAKLLKLFNWVTREWEPVNCQENELDILIQAHLKRLPTLEEFTSSLDINLN